MYVSRHKFNRYRYKVDISFVNKKGTDKTLRV